MAKKRGPYRPLPYCRDPKTDREIHGLKRRPDGRFYAAEHPTKTFGTNPLEAIRKFRAWEAERTNKIVPVFTPPKPVADAAEQMKR